MQQNGSVPNPDYFEDALNSDDSRHFSKDVIAAIANYTSRAKAYNEKSLQFNEGVTGVIRMLRESSFAKVGRSISVTPYTFILEDAQWNKVFENLRQVTYDYISVEVPRLRERRVEAIIPRQAFGSELSRLLEAFEGVRKKVIGMESSTEMLRARRDVIAAQKRLRETLADRVVDLAPLPERLDSGNGARQ
jgi:hypothetical protein